jgi:predicted NBD/HSP70 family sugar kinase
MSLDKEVSMVVAFDVGATHTRLALSKDGVLIDEIQRNDTDSTEHGFRSLVADVKKIGSGRKLSAVAGGMPGQIDSEGKFVLADNLAAWNGLPVVEVLEQAVGVPAYVGNDVVMAGIGEAQDGAGTRLGVCVYFTVSTGVNAVRLVGGWVDETIKSFNIGHELIVDGHGRVVSLESLTGGHAFEARKHTSPTVVRDGRTWKAEEHHLAHGLFNTLLHWTPQVVVFGGSMMKDIDLGALDTELSSLPDVIRPLPELRLSKLGDEAGLHGALAWARRKGH